jgi:hypothetical protein
MFLFEMKRAEIIYKNKTKKNMAKKKNEMKYFPSLILNSNIILIQNSNQLTNNIKKSAFYNHNIPIFYHFYNITTCIIILIIIFKYICYLILFDMYNTYNINSNHKNYDYFIFNSIC